MQDSESDRFTNIQAPNINVEELSDRKANLEDTQRDIPMDYLMKELTMLREMSTQTFEKTMKEEQSQTDPEKYVLRYERTLHLTIREMWAALLKHYTPEYIFNQVVQRNNREIVQ